MNGRDAERTAVGGLVMIAALVAATTLWFWVIREPPANYGCGEQGPPGSQLDAYRSGAILWHLIIALLLGALVWRLSALGHEHDGHSALPTASTGVALIAVGSFALYSLAHHDAFAVVTLPVGLGVAFAPWLVAILACLPAVFFLGAGYPTMAGKAAAWSALVIGIPASLVAIFLQGAGPPFC